MKRKFFNFSLMASISLFTFGALGLSACGNSSFVAAQVKLSESKHEMRVGDSYQLRAAHSKGYSDEARWFSSNESVAYVTAEGWVYAIGEGEATVTVAYAGGYADCKIIVSGQGGGEEIKKITLNPSRKTIQAEGSFTITANTPEGVTITEWKSSDATVASVTGNGNSAQVSAHKVGSASVSAIGSDNSVATCVVTVQESGGEEEDTGRDIAVGKNLNYGGKMVVGSPLAQRDFMTGLLSDFNRLTNSNIEFTVTTFEENNGTSGYNSAESMPAVFPYASDQTLNLSQFNALANVTTTDRNWIKNNMGNEAADAAKLGSTVGYPFASDNGVVMFYNTDLVKDPSEIDTLSKLFAKAEAGDYEVNYSVGGGFYAAGALMTYAKGKSLYKMTPSDTRYTATSTFNSAEGLQAAKLITSFGEHDCIRNAATAPKGDVIVTITDTSKVQSFKAPKEMGSKYAVTSVPFVDDEKTTRLGTYLGYKFYGVNNTLSSKTEAYAVAKFLCSEYAQAKRFDQFNVRPTLTSLQDYAKNEPHIAALTEQSKNNGTIPLTAIPSEVWSAAETTVAALKKLNYATAVDADYTSILSDLDKLLTKK